MKSVYKSHVRKFYFWNLYILAPSQKNSSGYKMGAIALLYPPPPRVRVRATAKLSAMFFHDESSIIIGGYESAIAPQDVRSTIVHFL